MLHIITSAVVVLIGIIGVISIKKRPQDKDNKTLRLAFKIYIISIILGGIALFLNIFF